MEPIQDSSPTTPPLNPEPAPVLPPQPSPLPLLIGSVIAILALAAAGYFYYQTTLLQSQLTTTQPPAETQEVVSPELDPTADWETNSFPNFNLTLRYPSESIALVDESKDNLSINFYPNSDKSFALQSRPYEGFDSLVIVNTPETLLINDQPWLISKIPTRTSDFGYGVAGNGPFYILQARVGNFLYAFFVSGDQLNQEQLQILSTFEFID